MADSEGERCEIFAKTYQHSEEMTTFAMHKEQMNPLGRHRRGDIGPWNGASERKNKQIEQTLSSTTLSPILL